MYIRDKYKIKNGNDFYMVGGMGHTLISLRVFSIK